MSIGKPKSQIDSVVSADFYGDYPHECVDSTDSSIPIATPATESERDRLFEFFRGHSKDESQTILSGACPACRKRGLQTEWVLLGIGFKLCRLCGWKDH